MAERQTWRLNWAELLPEADEVSISVHLTVYQGTPRLSARLLVRQTGCKPRFRPLWQGPEVELPVDYGAAVHALVEAMKELQYDLYNEGLG